MNPKMILFDYGGTLIQDPIYKMTEGNSAIFPYITENPYNVTKEQFSDFVKQLFDEIRQLRGELIEIHEHHFLRYVLEYFGIKLSISIEEAEWIISTTLGDNIMTPDADKMLKTLTEKGIKTGIISNLCWSGNALERVMAELFPEHKFEFIMTSSEYIFRKPDRHLFDLKSAIRLTDTTDFYIEDYHALHGFISGMISRDYDITHIFIDSITKIAGESFDEFDGFLCKLESLSDKYNVNFTITVSAPVASATDEIKKYITTL